MPVTKQALCGRISKAFDKVKYPGNGRIASRGWGCNPEIGDELEREFKGKHWRQVIRKTPAWFRTHYDALSAFTPEAFQFYLPAFVIKSIRNADALDLVPSWVIYNLEAPQNNANLMQFYKARVGRLNRTQRHALVDFLSFMSKQASEDDPIQAHIKHARLSLETFSNHTARH